MIDNREAFRILIALIKNQLDGTPIPEDIYDTLDETAARRLLQTAKAHGVHYMTAAALLGMDKWTAELSKSLRQLCYSIAITNDVMDKESERVYGIFEQAQISYIPLKGAIIKDLYPQPAMRRRHDLDILVRREDFDRAAELLLQSGFEPFSKTPHDISVKNERLVAELHHTLVEKERLNNTEPLERVWDHALPVNGTCCHRLEDGFFYMYTVAHLAKHFAEGGGCGIRNFIDLRLLDKLPEADHEGRQELLRQTGLLSFAAAIRQLGEVLFDGREPTKEDDEFVSAIFSSGIFGSEKNAIITLRARQSPGKSIYMEWLFPSMKHMIKAFPQLEKAKWLYPVYYVKRLCIHLRNIPGAIKRVKTAGTIEDSDIDRQKRLLRRLGLTEQPEEDGK